MKKFKLTDISLGFSSRPNDDIYTEYYPKEMVVELDDEDCVDDEKIYESLRQYIIETIEVEFDTPDEPYYEVDDANFEYEVIE